MKPANADRESLLSAAIVPTLVLMLACSGLFLASTFAADPAWWNARGTVLSEQVVTNNGVVTTNYIPNDYAAVTVGQLKQFTARAADELNADLPNSGGAGTALSNLVYGWQQDYATNGYATNTASPAYPYKPSDFQVATVGQLKYVASLVYGQLANAGYTGLTPSWIVQNTNTDQSVANIGQLKEVFDFDLAAVADAPGNLEAIASSNPGEIDLSWNPPSVNNATSITIQYSTDGGNTWTSLSPITDPTVTTYAVTGLDPDSSYEFSLSYDNNNAPDGSGSSGSVTTSQPATPAVPSPRYAVIDLGAHTQPLALSQTGYISLEDTSNATTTNFYRWYDGARSAPLALQDGNNSCQIYGGMYYDGGGIDDNGDIVGEEYSANPGLVNGVPIADCAVWPAGSTSPVALSSTVPGYINEPYTIGLWVSYPTVMDYNGTIYADDEDDALHDDPLEIKWFDYQTAPQPNGEITFVDLDPEGIYPGYSISGYAEEVFEAKNGHTMGQLIYYPNDLAVSPVNYNAVDNVPVNFSPQCINSVGWGVGLPQDSNGNPVGSNYFVFDTNEMQDPVPGLTGICDLNHQLRNRTNADGSTTPVECPQILGQDSTYEYTLFQKNPNTGLYESAHMADLIGAASGWSAFQYVCQSGFGGRSGINDSGAIVGTATADGSNPNFSAGSHGVMLIPAGMAVDANRDGTIVMANDANNPANAGLPVDTTSQAHPFRFWVNSFDERNEQDNIDSSYQDSSATTIVDQRDLENFTRLWIYNNVPSGFLGSTKVQFGLKWKSVTGTPSIRIFTAPFNGTQYLTSIGGGSAQSGPDGNAVTDKNGLQVIAPVAGAGADFIFADGNDNNYSPTNTERYYIFEGVGVGQGELVPVYLDSTGKEIGEGPGVWLDLENLKTMYKSSDADQFVQAWDETQQAIVFVHGWNMTADGSRTYAEDMFKRLWQRGFKGRFCYFRWDTGSGPLSNDFNLSQIEAAINGYLADYNDSEYTAWHSGTALNAFIGAAVPAGYSKNLVAHSMGNVVAGSGFLNGLSVSRYALLNAAIPSCCYDTSTARKQAQSSRVYPFPFGTVTLWGNLTPDDDPDPITQALAYRGRLSGCGSNNLFSFYLQNDAATEYAWELNNAQLKPAVVGADDYGYLRNNTAGQKLYVIDTSGNAPQTSYLSDPLEAMPYADQSWSKAAGADAGTGGAITGSLDMDASYQFGTDHSAEFDQDIQTLEPFYNQLLTTFAITPNP